MRLKYLFFNLAAGVFLSGCIKEAGNNFTNQESLAPSVANFPNQEATAALDISNTPTTYTFYAEVTSINNSVPSGTTVTIVKNNGLVTAAGMEPLPDSTFQLVNTSATVDPITHLAAFQVKISSTKIASGHDYAMGYNLSSAGEGITIASNKKTTLIGVTVKNQYDGDYHSTGYFYHPASPRAITNLAKTVSTVNATTSITTLGDLGNEISLTVDANNKVTITDVGVGPGIAPTTQLSSLPTGYTSFDGNTSKYNNTYDPATKTFYLRYGYQGASGWRVTEEVLKKD